MPLQENPNLANQQKAVRHSKPSKALAPETNDLSVMKTRSRALISVPTELKRRTLQKPLVDSPEPSVEDAKVSMNMVQINGHPVEQISSPQETSRPGRIISATMMRSGMISPKSPAMHTDVDTAALSNAESPTTPLTEPAWSSAIGHASTGKSGRVIEKLQAEIDRLRRENHLIKVQFDEVEKANETLAVRNQYLVDRNSNYEASHEANIRQLDRKERQVQDLREELKREKNRTARAEDEARTAMTNEVTWKDQANRAQAIAQQKETEYHTIASCRAMDNDRYQGGLDKIRANFATLLQQREQDVEKHKKLQIVAEQQRKTIQQLEQLTDKLNSNFRSYRSEIDSAIEGLRENAGTNDEAVTRKLNEMEEVTGQMRWIVNVEQVINHKQIPTGPTTRPASRREGDRQNSPLRERAPSSPSRKPPSMIDSKARQMRMMFSKATKT